MYFLRLVFCMMAYCVGVHSYAPQTDIYTKCDDTVFVAAAKELTLSTYMLASMPSRCKVELYASDLYEQDIRVMVSFPEFNLPCEEGKILLEGFSSGALEYCGSSTPPKSLPSNGQKSSITVQKKTGVHTFSSSLKVLVTEQNWFCSSTDFECGNGYCIDEILLTCDGNDNCGDNSDELRFTCFWSTRNTIAVVFGSTASVTFFMLLVIFLCRRRVQGRAVNVHSNSQIISTVTNTGIANPYYIQPQQNTPPYCLHDVNKC